MKKSLPFLVLICLATHPLHGTISTVYNMRIAETTKLSLDADRGATTSLSALTVFNQWRTTYRNVNASIGGGMISLVYIPSSFYARLDCAVANVYNETTHFTRTEPDDLLFSTGYSLALSQKTNVTFSGFLGLPLHADQSLDRIQFGYGHAGIGAQLDSSYVYAANKQHIVRYAARSIYFLPQTVIALNDVGCYEKVRFSNGVLTDLFIAHTSAFGNHKAEVGYNPTFLYKATISPSITDAKARSEYIRHAFYSTYGYSFSLKNVSSSVTVALSYAFDSGPKTFGFKRIVNAWALWGINF